MSELVDQGILLMLQDVMEDEYPQLLEAFLQDSQARLETMQRAYDCLDARAFWQSAHSFKGSCSNLGVKSLAQLCEQLEQRGRQSQLHGSEVLLAQVQRELAAVRLYFRGERQRYLLKDL